MMVKRWVTKARADIQKACMVYLPVNYIINLEMQDVE